VVPGGRVDVDVGSGVTVVVVPKSTLSIKDFKLGYWFKLQLLVVAAVFINRYLKATKAVAAVGSHDATAVLSHCRTGYRRSHTLAAELASETHFCNFPTISNDVKQVMLLKKAVLAKLQM
jgi:hypothetical protein